MSEKVGATYIMSNGWGNVLYTGSTADLVRRVFQHRNALDTTDFTARYRTFKLVHFEIIGDLNEAMKREKQIKGWSRAKKIALIRASNPEFDDLWPRITE
jgi:putative endonuclease